MDLSKVLEVRTWIQVVALAILVVVQVQHNLPVVLGLIALAAFIVLAERLSLRPQQEAQIKEGAAWQEGAIEALHQLEGEALATSKDLAGDEKKAYERVAEIAVSKRMILEAQIKRARSA